MRAEYLGIDVEGVLRDLQAQRARHRSQGRHLSEVVHYIVSKTQPNRFKDGARGGGPDPLVFHKGFLWEDILSAAFARSMGNLQMELVLDGIFMTLDGFSLIQRRVREYKCSKMKRADLQDIVSRKFQHWTLRTSGYCVGATHHFDELFHKAELVALFLNGSYELGGGRFGMEDAASYLLTWTPRELRENWEWILHARDEMDREGL